MSQDNLRTIVRGAYDLQKLRIQTGNRIVANFKAKLGQKPSKKEDTMDEEGRALLKDLRARYKKLTDGVSRFPTRKKWKGDELISTYTEFVMIAEYLDLEGAEEAHFERLRGVLPDYPIYSQYLESVKGVGPAMAGVIIGEIDIHEAEYPSSLWKYAGIDVLMVLDEETGELVGEGRCRKAHHLIDVEYENKDGEMATRKSLTFKPFLKTKLVGVLGPSFLKSKSPYADVYYGYRNRLQNHPKWKETTPLHRHRAAIRYMIKRFLADLYHQWRTLEGLPVQKEYAEAKLGIKHRAA